MKTYCLPEYPRFFASFIISASLDCNFCWYYYIVCIVFICCGGDYDSELARCSR